MYKQNNGGYYAQNLFNFCVYNESKKFMLNRRTKLALVIHHVFDLRQLLVCYLLSQVNTGCYCNYNQCSLAVDFELIAVVRKLNVNQLCSSYLQIDWYLTLASSHFISTLIHLINGFFFFKLLLLMGNRLIHLHGI